MMGSHGSRPDSIRNAAKSDPVVKAVRAAMLELGLHARIDEYEYHIRHKQKIAGIRYDYLRECVKTQRMTACDWMDEYDKARLNKPPEPPLIPPAVADRFKDVPNTDNTNGVYTNVAPKPPVPQPANVARVVEPPAVDPPEISPTVGETDADDKRKESGKRNLIPWQDKYKLTIWMDNNRNMIRNNGWHMGDLLAAVAEKFSFKVTEGNLVAILAELEIKLKPRPSVRVSRPAKVEPSKIDNGDVQAFGELAAQCLDAVADMSHKLDDALKRIAAIEAKFGLLAGS